MKLKKNWLEFIKDSNNSKNCKNKNHTHWTILIVANSTIFFHKFLLVSDIYLNKESLTLIQFQHILTFNENGTVVTINDIEKDVC